MLGRMRIVLAILLLSTTAFAQAGKAKPPAKEPPPKTFNIGPLSIGGKLHTISMLQFLERANEELERASLEKKSFVPKMAQSVDEAPL